MGMALGYGWYDTGLLPLLLLSGFSLSLSLLCRLLGVTAWPALFLAVCLLGMWRYEVSDTAPTPWLNAHGGTSQILGRIVSDPESTKTRVRFTLQTSSHSNQDPRGNGTAIPGGARILVYAHPPQELVQEREMPYFRYGDWVELTGALQRPEPIEQFDYPAYLESQGIYAIFWAQEASVATLSRPGIESLSTVEQILASSRIRIFDLRRALAKGMDASLPPAQANLAKALLLGLRAQLPEETVEDFRTSGTSHLLAISGLHLGILLLLALGTLRWALGRHTPVPIVLALAIVWLYVLISGAPASVVRAAIMGSVYLAALGLGRPRESLLPALALSAIAMTALEPRIASQISFQLSFAAMAGIALALPWQEAVVRSISGHMEGRRWGLAPALGVGLGWLASAAIISAAATLATFPLVALNFGVMPLLGIPATIVVTPLLPFALVGGLAAGFAGLIHPLLGQIMGLPASIPLSAMLGLVDLVPKWTVGIGPHGTLPTWFWYSLLLLVVIFADSRWYRGRLLIPLTRFLTAGRAEEQSGAVRAAGGTYLGLAGLFLILAAALVYIATGLFAATDGRLHVYFLDVGQGDAIFVKTPNGRQALIDGGPQFGGATLALSHHLPPWDRSLDLVASTHLDADHSRGLQRVMEDYRIGAVIVGLPQPESALYPLWRRAVEEGGHQPLRVAAGQRLTLDDGVTIEVLHPPATPLRGPAWDSNNNSLVLRLSYENISFLLTGDIEEEAERYLVRNSASLRGDVLKAGHHGSNSSSTTAFLNAVKPRWAVISAGLDNQYGHPHPEVLRRLERMVGRQNIFSTAIQGTIHFSTDGQRLWVETER